RRGGLAGVKFTVEGQDKGPPCRHLSDIQSLLEGAALPSRAKDRSERIFARLAEAEAKVHDIGIEEVHFHEVGAVDSIVDIVAACIALELLDVDRVLCSPIPVGRGAIECGHGVMPAPAPATTQLLIGARTAESQLDGEITTPTAAAVLTTLAESFGPLPEMEVMSIGYGAGTRTDGPLPNLLRVYIGRACEDGTVDTVVELLANIDDCSGELIGATIEKLLSAGCVDAWASPIATKKSRPAWTLSALCSPSDVAAAERLFFTETTTFGIRRRTCSRTKLQRRHETVETPYGPVRIKVGSRGGEVISAQPEFSDCRKAAQAHHVPIKEVFAAAEAIYRMGAGK
ncbi:MAG: nickel pincer cofactor biosynthesis protein LarC, partial [Phycisphaerae bacterium]|nr:nickel pincer cofactor biosynthesis protein LarC [Phycisphaerae bacterium]